MFIKFINLNFFILIFRLKLGQQIIILPFVLNIFKNL